MTPDRQHLRGPMLALGLLAASANIEAGSSADMAFLQTMIQNYRLLCVQGYQESRRVLCTQLRQQIESFGVVRSSKPKDDDSQMDALVPTPAQPSDHWGRPCLEATRLEQELHRGSVDNCATRDAAGRCMDIAHRWRLENKCQRKLEVQWAFKDKYFTGKPTNLATLLAGEHTVVRCFEVLHDCVGELVFEARWAY